MKQFLLRYGVFAILLVMAAGLFLILGALSIRQKAPVQIFVTGAATARAYLTPAPSVPVPAPGDTLRVVQTAGGDMAFTVDSLRAEGSDIALSLRATAPRRPQPPAGRQHLHAGLRLHGARAPAAVGAGEGALTRHRPRGSPYITQKPPCMTGNPHIQMAFCQLATKK